MVPPDEQKVLFFCFVVDELESVMILCLLIELVNFLGDKIVVEDDDRLVSDESDLASISDKLRLLSIGENSEAITSSEKSDVEMVKSDEELARMLQVLHL